MLDCESSAQREGVELQTTLKSSWNSMSAREGATQAAGGIDTVCRRVYGAGGQIMWGRREWCGGEREEDLRGSVLAYGRWAQCGVTEKGGAAGRRRRWRTDNGAAGGGGAREDGESASRETGEGGNERERQLEGGIVAVARVLTSARNGSVREGRGAAGRVGVGGRVGVAREWDVGARRARWVLDAKGGVVGSTGGGAGVVRRCAAGVAGFGGERSPAWAGVRRRSSVEVRWVRAVDGGVRVGVVEGGRRRGRAGRGVWCGDVGCDASALLGVVMPSSAPAPQERGGGLVCGCGGAE
ncbi:hypothetical protein B0H16DRAFT_1768347 [Mycena metata]|uniref:Uncharacterized protein n=1 Tax=Mycena metata TaxID=1033252 RepID=A0AAD7I456_9AGAR|nr:hypothetical protein B0H16DRAFT_1768347 [Mycena metata]